MTTSWQDINKPSGTGYTNIPKPLGTSSIISQTYSGGQPIGLLLALTQSSVIGVTSIVTSTWVNIAKAT